MRPYLENVGAILDESAFLETSLLNTQQVLFFLSGYLRDAADKPDKSSSVLFFALAVLERTAVAVCSDYKATMQLRSDLAARRHIGVQASPDYPWDRDDA